MAKIQESKGSTWLHKSFFRFLPTTYTTTKDVDLVWEDFIDFYILMYFSIYLLEHALAQFLN
jgi:hypothetical protein